MCTISSTISNLLNNLIFFMHMLYKVVETIIEVQVIGAEESYPRSQYSITMFRVGSLKSHVSNIIIKLIMFYL